MDPRSDRRHGAMSDEEAHRQRTIREVFEEGEWVGADQLSAPRQPAADWEQERRVFSVDYDGRRYYARYQFDASLQPLPVIKEVLAAFGDADPWAIAAWFHYPSAWLVEDHEQGTRNVPPKNALDRRADVVEAAIKRFTSYVA